MASPPREKHYSPYTVEMPTVVCMMGDPDPRDPPVEPVVGLVRDFVNTVEWQEDADLWQSPVDLATWLSRRSGVIVAEASDADLDLARRIREGLRSTLLAHAGHAPLPSSIDDLNGALADLPIRLAFDMEGESAVHSLSTGGAPVALTRIIAAVDELRRGDRWGRLKACARDSCRWAYWDSSRNQSGRWCSMAGCGNAVKMARRDGRVIPVVGSAGGERAATLVDVAGRAGVSMKTVSNVVTGAVPVSARTRERVEAAIAALDYRPNLAARALKAVSVDSVKRL
jgi:predicted RNA-binding Zn ribbon-like protein